jgi:azurin
MKDDRNHLTAPRVLTLLTFVFSAVQAHAAKPPKGFEKIDQEIVITTMEAKMMYDKASFSVKPNAKIKLVLKNLDSLPHNLIICTPGKKKGGDKGKEVIDAVLKLGDKGVEQNWEPKGHPRILKSSGMVQPKEATTIFFKAPGKEGNYPYICTFPGHYQLMNGMMKVSKLSDSSRKLPPIRDLLSYTHLGKFKTLTDLRKTKAVNVEEEKKGLISLQHAALKKNSRDNYGIVWEGWIDVPRDGKYTFTYDTDDGGSLAIGGKEIITRNYVGPAGKPSKGSIALKKGRVDIKVEYYELSGEEHVSLSWEGPKMKRQYLSDTKTSGGGNRGGGGNSIPVVAPAGEAIIYRNFIAGTDPRGIGAGYSEGVNLAFSADSMSLDMIWKGDFIDGGRHWINRGQGFQPPAGDQVITLNRGIPFAILESQTSKWPNKADGKMEPRFKGYSLNKQQQPTFKYHFGPVAALDYPAPKDDGSGFTRTITINVPSPGSAGEQLYFRVLSGGSVQSGSERTFSFEDDLILNVLNSELPPFTRENELLIPIPLTPGKHAVTIDYTWK